MGPWRAVGDGEWVGTDACAEFPIYTRGNAGEVYPEVYRPLSFSIAAEAGERAMRATMLATGVIRPEEIEGIPITTAVGGGVFGGYAYLNLSIQRLGAARLPGGEASDADRIYMGGGDTEPPPHRPAPNERNLRATWSGVRNGVRVLRTTELAQLAGDRRRIDEHLMSLPDPATATDADLLSVASEQLVGLFTDLFETHLQVSSAAGAAMSVLTRLCDRQLGDAGLAVRLVAGLGGVDSAAPSVALWRLGRTVRDSRVLTAAFDAGTDDLWQRLRSDPAAAEFVADLGSFLAEFGSRGPNEWDTAFDTWETDPALALVLVDRMRAADPSHDPVAQRARLAAERDVFERDALSRLRRPLRPVFRRTLLAARVLGQGRERSKTTIVRLIHGARLAAQELDRRLVARSGGRRGDLWFLVAEELDDYVADPAAFAPTIAERRRMLAELERRVPPFYFEGRIPPLEEWALRDAAAEPVIAGEVIAGIAGCAGVARGRARIVTDPADPRGLEPGDVLVAPLTDPSWTPLFVPAEAVVVDVGAAMSHAIIVSRELGIPCTVSAREATRRIPDGALVEVDGGAGTVTILELS